MFDTAFQFVRLLVAAVGLLLGALVSVHPVTAQPEDSTTPLRRLAERALGDPKDLTLAIGGLPDSVQSVVPLPDGARVLGAVRRAWSVPQRPAHLQIYADVDAAPVAVLRFYAERLPDAGWTAPEQAQRSRSGFVPPEARFPNRYCRGDSTMLQIRPSDPDEHSNASDGLTRLDLQYVAFPENVRRSPCIPPAERRRAPRQTDRLIPELVLPDFASEDRRRQRTATREHSHTLVTADTTVHALHDHFASALGVDGWVLIEQGGDGRVRWSDWRIPRDAAPDGRGHLAIQALPPDGTFAAHVFAVPVAASSR